MSSEQILVWIVVGGIAGILAEALEGGLRSGLLGAIVVGILGAIIGGWLFGVLGVSVGTGILADIITAFIGAALLLLILRSTRRL
ncbi:MAG: GlsB/YeaQ/YmgE family stress response membrane protein [Chloroflexi bacterium]|nr:MAG: GlsB/YeaQ/YmgE family stress response membrane protein [Chloroflexota bacterium]